MKTTLEELDRPIEFRDKLSEADLALLLKESKPDDHSRRFVVIARLIRRVGLIGIVIYTLLQFIPSPVPLGDVIEPDPAEMQLKAPTYSSADTVSGTVATWDWGTVDSK